MTVRLCPGCGQSKRIRWDAFCSMRCAAMAAAIQYEAGSNDFYCTHCGDIGCQRYHDEGDDG